MSADFVIATIGPAQDGEVADIDLSDTILADYDLAKDSVGYRNGTYEELALLV